MEMRQIARPNREDGKSMIEHGDIDLSFVVTHRMPLDQAPLGYEIFKNELEDCIKVVLKP
jgi:threonine dehydrogenase-like Zn-dependent dehydrogenase